MSAQVAITQLPAAGAITGTEAVPIVQNGVTVQTTTGAISASPSQTYTYLTVNQTPQLANSRYFGATNGLSISDGGAQGLFNISTTGALLSLVNSGTGFQVKTSSTAITGRSIAVTGVGLGITNGDGIAGNPTIALAGQVLSLANLSANGLMTITTGGVLNATSIVGIANQIGVANGDGVGGSPTVSIADNAIFPGTGSVTVPNGTSAQQPAGANGQIRFNTDVVRFQGFQGGSWYTFGNGDGTVTSVSGTASQITVVNSTTTPTISIAADPVLPGSSSVTLPRGGTAARPLTPTNGMLRYNTDTALLEAYLNGAWTSLASGSGVTSVATGTGLMGGPITSTGTISIANTAVTAGSYTAADITVNAQGQITAASSTTALVSTFSAGTTGFTPATATSGAITLAGTLNVANGGTGATTLTGYLVGNGTSAVTAVATIPNAGLTNSSLTIGTTAISLGASSLTLGGLTTVTVTQDPTSALDLATKQYVDAVAEGLHIHASCAAATTGTLASITGGTVTYNNGTAGVGATLTLSVALTVLDGYTLLNGDRVLVKNEATQANNGIYTWATGGLVLTRATDFDTAAEMASGDFTFVINGTLYANTGWVQTDPVTIVGTSPVTWVQFSGAGAYTAGTGLTLTGTQFSITNTAVTAGAYGSASSVGTFTVNAQGQLTLAGSTAIAIANTQVSGLGTMSTQNANSVAVTGGAIDGTTVGATTATTVRATTVTTTGTGSPTDGAGQIYLNGATSNRIDFNTNGTGAPAFTTRSAGTKLLLYPSLSSSVADYAIGIAAATMWSSVPENNSSFKFKWYGATTEVASLDGAGAFTAVGGISGGTF